MIKGYELLTIAEASKMSRMSQAWWRQRIFKGEVEHVKLGRRVFIKESYLKNMIEKNTFKPKLHKWAIEDGRKRR